MLEERLTAMGNLARPLASDSLPLLNSLISQRVAALRAAAAQGGRPPGGLESTTILEQLHWLVRRVTGAACKSRGRSRGVWAHGQWRERTSRCDYIIEGNRTSELESSLTLQSQTPSASRLTVLPESLCCSQNVSARKFYVSVNPKWSSCVSTPF